MIWWALLKPVSVSFCPDYPLTALDQKNRATGVRRLLLRAVGAAPLAARTAGVGSVVGSLLGAGGGLVGEAQAKPGGLALAQGQALPVWQARGGEQVPGQTRRIEDFRGRWVYLDYWASWCPPCRLSFPWMDALQTRYGACGLEVVTVSVDTREARIAEFVRQTPASVWILWDRQSVTAQALDLKAMPSSFLIDPEGRLVSAHQGFGQAQADAVEKTLARVLGPGCKT